MRALKQWVRSKLAASGYVVFNTNSNVHYARDCLFTTNNHAFREDIQFRTAYARGIAASHGVDPSNEWRLHVALWCAVNASRRPGCFVECGVNAGFTSSAVMHRLNWQGGDRHYYLIDTFAGPVVSQFSDDEISEGRLEHALSAQRRGAYVNDLARIEANFDEWPNVKVVQGVVPDVLSTLDISQVAFLHLDMNCAYPEASALRFFWPLMSTGGMVLLDDYAYFGNDVLKKAIDDVATELDTCVLSLPTGQGLIIKH